MDIGVLTVPLGGESIDDAVAYLDDIGVDAVELGVGGWPSEDHVDREAILDDDAAQAELRELLDEHGLRISALATHNNPSTPTRSAPRRPTESSARRSSLPTSWTWARSPVFSGLPAGAPGDSTPNWITAPWPSEHADAHEYQWDEVAIPYWTDLAKHADHHGVDVAIEMHPNMLVYEPTGMLALREATNERIGANFDPSHLYWQGIDVIEAIRFLGDHDAIHHFHAKDTKVYDANAREGRTRHDELHRRERSLVAVPFDRLRPRREPLEGRRLDAPDGRVRGRAVDRTRGLADLLAGGVREGGRRARPRRLRDATGRRLLGGVSGG